MRSVISPYGCDELEEPKRCPRNEAKRTAALGLGVLVGLFDLSFAFAAAAQTTDTPAATIAGRILDDQGQPVAGAEVWMPLLCVGRRWDDKPDATPHATSDAQGNYVLIVPAAWSGIPINERQWIVWAHARDRRIGIANTFDALSGGG